MSTPHRTSTQQRGQLLADRYEIVGQLGTGGFGQVLRCRDRQIRREVALKLLFAPATDSADDAHLQTVNERFRIEVEIMAALQHPSIVRVFDAGVLPETGQAYIVMEYLEGHSLRQHLRKHGAMAPARFIPHFAACLEGLGEAHERGIVHRDLNPNNLFLCNPDSRRESLRVLDFGISRAHAEASSELTGHNSLLGTPNYYAPEYIVERRVSPPLDVYQMGLILVEALTGRRVVEEPDPLLAILRHRDADLRVPDTIARSPLGAIVRTALHRDPDARFPSGYAFADALAAIDVASLPSMVTGPQSAPTTISTSRPRFAGAARIPSTDQHAVHELPTHVLYSGDVVLVSGPSTAPRPAPAASAAALDAPALPPRRGLLTVAVGIATIGLAALLVVGGFVVRMSGETKPVADPPTRTATAADGAANATATPLAPSVELSSIPTVVTLTDSAGTVLGTTPYTIRFNSNAAAAVELVASHEGFISQTVILTPSTDSSLLINLDREPEPTVADTAAPEPAATPRPPAEARPETPRAPARPRPPSVLKPPPAKASVGDAPRPSAPSSAKPQPKPTLIFAD